MRQSRLCDKKVLRLWGAWSHIFSYLKDSLLTSPSTHMVKCALTWCRFSLGIFMLFFSLSAFSCFPVLRVARVFTFLFPLTMGFPFLSIFFTMLAWKTCWSGMGNDWWIREKREKSFTCSWRFIIACFFLFSFHMKRRPKRLKILKIFCLHAIFFPHSTENDDCRDEKNERNPER